MTQPQGGWLVGDIETDGFLEVMSTIHCIVLYDWDAEKYLRFNDQPHPFKQHRDYAGTIDDAVRMMNQNRKLFFHNGHGFDFLALKWFHPEFNPKTRNLMDTRFMATAVFRDVKGMDFAAMKQNKRPADFAKMQLVGKHSLKAWGYRLGVLKSTIADEAGETDWSTFTPEMEDYCVQDVVVTVALLKLLTKPKYLAQHPMGCHELDNHFQHIISRQEAQGFMFDEPKANELFNELQCQRLTLEKELRDVFKCFYKAGKLFTPKRDNKKEGYVAGCTFTKVELTEFSPGSRDHIQNRLQRLYGWQPLAFGADGKATVDESTLTGLPYPTVPLLLRYLKVSKILGQLATGKKAWLKYVKNGRMHGRIDTMGAVTWRCTHSHPNMGQVPSVDVDGVTHQPLYGIAGGFGADCRDLFTVRRGRSLCGHDGSGLELRCLGHYMARYDGGAYANEVVNGDVHTLNQRAVGLNKRANAKTWIYAFLYGAGDFTLGMTVLYDMTPEQQAEFYATNGNAGPKYETAVAALGSTSKKRIAKSLPALGALIKAVKDKAKATGGELRALDGRQLKVRAIHAALNTVLQSAGALLMKRWLVIHDEALQEAGMVPDQWRYKGWDRKHSGGNYEFNANVHDEAQTEVDDDKVTLYDTIAKASFPLAGAFHKFNCAIAGDGKSGRTWTQTH